MDSLVEIKTIQSSSTSTDQQARGARVDVPDLLRILGRCMCHLIGMALLARTVTALVLVPVAPFYRAGALVLLELHQLKATNTTDVLSGIINNVITASTEMALRKSAALLARVATHLAGCMVFRIRWESTRDYLTVSALQMVRYLGEHVGVVLSQFSVRRHAKPDHSDDGYCYSKNRNYCTQ